MLVIELFCGTKSISREFEKRGHTTFTVDFDERFNPNLCKDIMEIALCDLPKTPDVIWASPPCQTFSVASISKYWTNGFPKNTETIIGKAILYKTLWIISKLKPRYWFIENPRGMMRKDGLLIYLQNLCAIRRTVTYCQYGESRMKPTDIWTNCKEWIPRKPCKAGDKCHDYQPRGYHAKIKSDALGKGTQGMKNRIERAIIPKLLCNEIVEATSR